MVSFGFGKDKKSLPFAQDTSSNIDRFPNNIDMCQLLAHGSVVGYLFKTMSYSG